MIINTIRGTEASAIIYSITETARANGLNVYDKIYRNRENLAFCKLHGILLSGPSLGRPRKNTVVNKKIEYVTMLTALSLSDHSALRKGATALARS